MSARFAGPWRRTGPDLLRVAFPPLHVGQVLEAAARALVPEQGRAPEERDREAVEFALDARLPGLVEGDPADLREDVDATRRQADLVDHPGPGEILGLHTRGAERRPEGLQRAPGPLGVGWRGPDQNVDVPGRTRHVWKASA